MLKAIVKKDVGNDLIVWTKHFTEFVTFTQTAKASSGGGGGGVVYGGNNSSVATTYQTYNPATGQTTIGQAPTTTTTPTPSTPATTGGQVLGIKAYADGTLLRNSKKQIFAIVKGQRQYIKNLQELAKNYKGKKIIDVTDDILQAYDNAVLGVKTYANGTLLRNSKKQIFAIVKGQKQYVKNLQELAKNYKGKPITDVNDVELSKY
ncbi:MAG: hypothetical protein V1765_03055 [bacterium]